MNVAEIKRQWFTNCVNNLVDKGLTKTAISQKLGIVPQSLNNILTGSRGISDKFMDKFVETFNLSLKDLFILEYTPDNEHEQQIPLIPISAFAGKEQRIEKWEAVSSHTARRSAATNMFKAGISSISIMKITGHKTETQFMKYIKVSKEDNAEMLMDNPFFQK